MGVEVCFFEGLLGCICVCGGGGVGESKARHGR
jgi:hypothetical protein